MVELKDYIDDVEVGMVIGLYNREKYSFISGIVTRKILMHDKDTHEECCHLEMDVDDFIKEITDIGKYKVFMLLDKNGRDLVKIDLNEMRDFYFPDAYTDPVEVFCDMVELLTTKVASLVR